MASAAPPSSPGPKGDEPEPQGMDPEGAAANIQAPPQERPWRPPVYIETFIGGEGLSEEDSVSSEQRIRRLRHRQALKQFLKRLESRPDSDEDVDERARDEDEDEDRELGDTNDSESSEDTNQDVPRVFPSVTELANIRVVPIHTKRLPFATSGLTLEPFNADQLKKFTDKSQIVPDDPIKANKWAHRWEGFAPRGLPDTIDASYESLDCAETSSILRRYADAAQPHFWATERWTYLKRYLVVVLIGPMTAGVALAIEQSIKFITHFKYEMLAYLLNKAFKDGGGGWSIALAFSVTFNVVSASLAAACIHITPEAQGSGIPQVKCYLNGVNVPKLVRIKTLFCKAVGVVFSVSAGFAVGKEGPMIHSGAAIGAGISQGKSSSNILGGLFPINTKFFPEFRNDKEKRDFVACGSAAGVAAAFGAPIGGLLFAIEEGASHVSQKMLWLVTITACTCYVVLQLSKSCIEGVPGELNNGGLISFGRFDDVVVNGWQMLVFFLMAIFAASSGALFNHVNKKLTQFRLRAVHSSKTRKFLEVLLVAVGVSLVAYLSVTNDRDCERIDLHSGNGGSTPFTLNCPFGNVNSAANLWYRTPESVVKALLHDENNSHHWKTLIVFTTLYWVLAVCNGMGISNGLFVPSLLIGAAWGRLVGMGLHYYLPDTDWGDVGKYALIGACAQLAATVRLTYSLTAIVIEAIGNMTYLFPVLMTVVVSKHLADLFSEGIYDIHIDLMGIPMMEAQAAIKARFISARHIMSTPVQVLPTQASVKDVLTVLKRTTHNAFPVVDTEPDFRRIMETDPEDKTLLPTPHYGRLRGIVGRNEIMTMISKKIFVNAHEFGLPRAKESYEKLRESYPRFPQAESVDMSDEDQTKFRIDFSLAMDLAPITVRDEMTYTAVYDLVRSAGLRHVVVTNYNNEVVGMITRKDLVVLDEEFETLYEGPTIKYKPAFFPAKFKEDYYDTTFRESHGAWNQIRRRRTARNYSTLENGEGGEVSASANQEETESRGQNEEEASSNQADQSRKDE